MAPESGGTAQPGRRLAALVPSSAPVDGRSLGHGILFARELAALVDFFDVDNVRNGNWQQLFSGDVSVPLAVAAVQDVGYYRERVKEYFDFLKNLTLSNTSKEDERIAKEFLSALFSVAGSAARQLDLFKENLPVDHSLRAWLENVIRTQLAPSFKRLISYYKGDLNAPKYYKTDPETEPLVGETREQLTILGTAAVPFKEIYDAGLSAEWRQVHPQKSVSDIGVPEWISYREAIPADISVYGKDARVALRANHIATHNLFTSIFDQFLKSYARLVRDAEAALRQSLTDCDTHQPHYALFLAFLQLMQYARDEANTITRRHLDFYFRKILGLKKKPSQPSKAHLLVELAKGVSAHLLAKGALFTGGKDEKGNEAFFANDRDFVANEAKVASIKCVYHDAGVLLASPVADSDDGKGAELASPDKSWHPFHTSRYVEGSFMESMPQAEVGFAVASHHLLLAEGGRTVTVEISCLSGLQALADITEPLRCSFTGEKGWIEPADSDVHLTFSEQKMTLVLKLNGTYPAVVPYAANVHNYFFDTGLPLLLVRLRDASVYEKLGGAVLSSITLTVEVDNLKTVKLSSDFGPLDPATPFPPFGHSPKINRSLVIGSKEVFQKALDSFSVTVQWQNRPTRYVSEETVLAKSGSVPAAAPQMMLQPKEKKQQAGYGYEVSDHVQEVVEALSEAGFEVAVEYLQGGTWFQCDSSNSSRQNSSYLYDKGNPWSRFTVTPQKLEPKPYLDAPVFSPAEPYSTSSRYGFLRLRLTDDLGEADYQQALVDYLKSVADPNVNDLAKPVPPVSPVVTQLSLYYKTSAQTLDLTQATPGVETLHFLHLTPFGTVEQHPDLKQGFPQETKGLDLVSLLPRFSHYAPGGEATHCGELYIGVSGLKPPQNLALLFQVADGTSDPQLKLSKPLHWSYLCRNEWLPFAQTDVADRTAQFLKSGIITFSMPAEASADNTLLPKGMHWIRGAVEQETDAACRLIKVAAQGVETTFADHGNDPTFPASVLSPGTIKKLAVPDAAVKKIDQPFPSYGGRGEESPEDFDVRVSERLRHKDRGIALWDYERLILEAFPQIYLVRCLNHTLYDNVQGEKKYCENASGHVTVICIPNQRITSLRDPLRPYTSQGVLDDVREFLRKRLSCFVELHVKNPQFEEVWVECSVRFREGADISFSQKEMNEAITRFLSPWAFSEASKPSFGGKIYKAALINFVEDLPYVDYVTDFLLYHSNEDDKGEKKDKDEIVGSKAVSVLVSRREHTISPV